MLILTQVGDRIKRPRLAETLRTLSQQNDTNIFYNGTMGQQLIKEIKGFGGIMEMEDLQDYTYVTLCYNDT